MGRGALATCQILSPLIFESHESESAARKEIKDSQPMRERERDRATRMRNSKRRLKRGLQLLDHWKMFCPTNASDYHDISRLWLCLEISDLGRLLKLYTLFEIVHLCYWCISSLGSMHFKFGFSTDVAIEESCADTTSQKVPYPMVPVWYMVP